MVAASTAYHVCVFLSVREYFTLYQVTQMIIIYEECKCYLISLVRLLTNVINVILSPSNSTVQ